MTTPDPSQIGCSARHPLPVIPTEPELPPAGGPPPPAIPRMAEDPGDPVAESAREKAFDAVFRWQGAVLLPFSSSRRGLFFQHRVAVGAPPMGDCVRDLHGFIPDAIRILFLCTHEPDAPVDDSGEGWATLRSDPRALQAAIDRWADAAVPAALEVAAYEVAMDIYAKAYANRHEPAPGPAAGADLVGN